jgi:hypothetical protein
MTWIIPMGCHIKMPFSGVTKTVLMETHANTIFLYYVLLAADSPTADRSLFSISTAIFEGLAFLAQLSVVH